MRQLATKPEFDAAVAAAGLVVIDFTATWCGPCQAIAPKLEALAQAMPDASFFKVDVDENEDTAEEHEVSAMPTFLFFLDGSLKAKTTGADFAAIEAEIAKWRPKPDVPTDAAASATGPPAATDERGRSLAPVERQRHSAASPTPPPACTTYQGRVLSPVERARHAAAQDAVAPEPAAPQVASQKPAAPPVVPPSTSLQLFMKRLVCCA